jgi:hypothetical protein
MNSEQRMACKRTRDTELRSFEDLIQAVSVFLISRGHSSTALAIATKRALARARAEYDRQNEAQAAYICLARMLHAWHHENTYLDREARPAFLPLRGKVGSLARLTQDYGQPLGVGQVVALLNRHKLVRRTATGRLVPTDSVFRFRASGAELTGYLGRSLLHLASTMKFNLSRSAKNGTLIERAALVRELPISSADEFRRYSAEQGEAFIENIDNWLESRNGPTPTRRKVQTASAGVHVFAFVDRNRSGSRRGRSPTS